MLPSEIQGLDTGVGLVPQGRLGSGIANVFDTDSVAANLARLGARMENLEKLKLATAAKLASAKQKEDVAKAVKPPVFQSIAASGKAAYRSGNRVIQKLHNTALQDFYNKKASGDYEGANQVVPLVNFAQQNVNNKTASIESDIDNFWKSGAGQFYLPNEAVESNIEAARPDDYEKYLNFDELGVRNQIYKEQTGTYNIDAVGKWAKDQSGKITLQKRLPNGKEASVSGISALFKLPLKKDGTADEKADLEIDYDVAKEFYATNPYIREQMQKFGDIQKEKALASEDYKKATTDEQRKSILEKAVNQGENNYIYATLRGRGDKDVRNNLEATYRKAAAQKKAEGDVEKDYQSGMVGFNFTGRVNAEAMADPKKKQGVAFDYNYGQVPNYNFTKNPQQINTNTQVVPMGDPQILKTLGFLQSVDRGKNREYLLTGGSFTTGNIYYVKDAYINQTNNRRVSGLKGDYLMPKGIMLPNGYSPYQGDESSDGFIVMMKAPQVKNLTQAQIDALAARGYTDLRQIQQGLEIPIFIKRNQGSGPALENFINNEFPNLPLPKSTLSTAGY